MKVEYFWEYEYKFGEFLKKIFPTYKRKFSLAGNGIYNLIYLDNKVYEIKFSKALKMLENDGRAATDKNKAEIINLIAANLKNKYTINSGKFITFTLGDYIAKVEIIAKRSEPV